jgi:hypothetical protein
VLLPSCNAALKIRPFKGCASALRNFLVFHTFRRAVNVVVLGGWIVRRHDFATDQIVFIPLQAFDVLPLLI